VQISKERFQELIDIEASVDPLLDKLKSAKSKANLYHSAAKVIENLYTELRDEKKLNERDRILRVSAQEWNQMVVDRMNLVSAMKKMMGQDAVDQALEGKDLMDLVVPSTGLTITETLGKVVKNQGIIKDIEFKHHKTGCLTPENDDMKHCNCE